MRVLIRAPNWVGDAVMALPAVESVVTHFADAQIFIGAPGWTLGLFTDLDGIAGTLSLPSESRWSRLRDSSKKIKALDIDIGLLMSNSFNSALGFYLAAIPERWGYSRDGRRFLLTRRAAVKKDTGHQVDYYLDLIGALGIPVTKRRLEFPLPPGSREGALNILASAGVDTRKPLAVLNPGAKYGSAKRWPAERFATLADRLYESHQVEVLIIGSADETELAESIAAASAAETHVLTGKTSLPELAGLIASAEVFVTNDSGPMHLANALGRPVIAIFGPTQPDRTGPFQPPFTLFHRKVPCWPCFYRKCPYGHECMMHIQPEEVYQACRTYLP